MKKETDLPWRNGWKSPLLFKELSLFLMFFGVIWCFCKTLSRHFFFGCQKNSSNCLRKNSSSFSIGSKRKNGFSPSSELLHTKFQFWRVRFSLPSHFPSPNTVAEIYRFCPKIHGRFVVLYKNTLSRFRNWFILFFYLVFQISLIALKNAYGFRKKNIWHYQTDKAS